MSAKKIIIFFVVFAVMIIGGCLEDETEEVAEVPDVIQAFL